MSEQLPAQIHQPISLLRLLSNEFGKADELGSGTLIIRQRNWTTETTVELSENDELVSINTQPTVWAWGLIILASAAPFVGVLVLAYILHRGAERERALVRRLRKVHEQWRFGVYE